MSRKSWKDWLIEPSVLGLNHNTAGVALVHRRVLQKKPMLRELFNGFYRECMEMDKHWLGASLAGTRIELGSGSGLIKTLYSEVLTSDIKALPFVDIVLDAGSMPLADDSVRALYGINIFHHLPNPRVFFQEALRVLAPLGGIVLIEPYYGPFAHWLFRRLHDIEKFDPHMADWEASDIAGPAVGANQALSYIVFRRDRAIFEREYPGLELLLDRPHTHLLYLLSGGVNFRQLVPDWFLPAVRRLDGWLQPLNPLIALQHTIVLRKKG